MTKKVSFGPKPTTKEASKTTADDWVDSRAAEETKRLTLDLPASLHKRIKTTCAMRGTKMTDEIRKLLEENYPK